MRLWLGLSLFCLCAHAAETVESLETAANALEKRIAIAKAELQKKVFHFHKKKLSSSELNYLWENPTEQHHKKEFAEKILSFDIQKNLANLRMLQDQLDAVLVEEEWLKWNLSQSNEATASLPKTVASQFRCLSFPTLNPETNPPMKLLQDFGVHKDQETGLSWPSMGWWMSGGDGSVRSCQAGVLAFWGQVSGRNWVAIVDHQNGWSSVYGNLSPAIGENFKLKVGQKIKAGTTLGEAKLKFYFEVRKEGVPQSPRDSFSVSLMPKLESESL